MSETPHFHLDPLVVKGKRPKVKQEENKPEEKPVDLNDPTTYLNEKYAKNLEKDSEGPVDTQSRLVALNNKLIEGYTQIYVAKTDAELQRIVSNEVSKPWEKAAAQAVLHKRMSENDVPLDKVTQKNWPTGREEDEEEEA